MRKNRGYMFFRLLAFLTVAIILLPLMGGCRFLENERNPDIANTIIMDLKVNPPTGSKSFNLTVVYSYYQMIYNRPAMITCEYVRPDTIEGDIGSIFPQPPETGGGSPANGTKVNNQDTLSFSVERPDGSVQEGQYKALCSTELKYHIEIPFHVKKEEAAAPAVASEIPAVQEEPTLTPTPMPTLKLQIEMTNPGKGYVLTGKWAGNLVVNPDGTIRAKTPGTFSAVVPIEMNNGTDARYTIDATFNVDIAGTAEFTSDGVRLLLQQTYADYKVLPVTIASGSIDGATLASIQKADEENVPNWLDQILTSLEIQGASLPITQDASVGRWKGTLTLSLAQ